MKKRNLIVATSLAQLCMVIASLAHADVYPSRPVRLIVPFPPGGSVDYVARVIGTKLGENLGQPIVVDNRGGASGTIGTYEASRASPDGYTLLLVFDSHAVNNSLYKNLKYDTFKSFDYISLIGTMPVLLMTSRKSGLDSLPKLLAAAKAAPGTINYGSSGVGGSNHLNAAALESAGGIALTHVPYKGGGAMLNAILAGEVDVVIASLPSVLGFAKSSQVNALAVGSERRISQLPDVPTVADVLPGYRAQSWVGMLAPAGVPKDVFGKIEAALQKTLQDPAIKSKLQSEAFNLVASTPRQFEEQVLSESKKWAKLVQEKSITVD